MSLIFFVSIFRVLFVVQLGVDFTNRFLYLNMIFIIHKEHKFGLSRTFLYLHTHSSGKAQANNKCGNERVIDVKGSGVMVTALGPGV